MGYQKSREDPSGPARIELRSISKRDFELMTAFVYVTRAGETVEVPIHPNDCAKSTDLASVPPLLWGLLPSYGRQLRAALLHDRLCDVINKHLADGKDRSNAYRDRRVADDIFFEAMRDTYSGGEADSRKRIGWFRARLFWVGVSYGRYWKFRRRLAVLLTAHVLVGVLAVGLLLRFPPLQWLADSLSWSWLQNRRALLLIWAAAVAGCILWRRDWRVPLLGLIVGPLILPVLAVTFVVQMLLGLPDQLLHVIKPEEQPKGDFVPTVTLTLPRAQP